MPIGDQNVCSHFGNVVQIDQAQACLGGIGDAKDAIVRDAAP